VSTRRTAVVLLALLLCVGIAAAGCGSEGTETPPEGGPLVDSIHGEWAGTLQQAETKPFPIRVRIESAETPEKNVVRYGGEIGCGGTWRYLGGDDSSARFRETIDRGAGGRCKGSGIVTLTSHGGDRLDYRFAGGGVESRGLLSRP
jgi:hypothetical protein